MQIKKHQKLVQMSGTTLIVYTFHPSLHHANFRQFKAKLDSIRSENFSVDLFGIFRVERLFFLNGYTKIELKDIKQADLTHSPSLEKRWHN